MIKLLSGYILFKNNIELQKNKKILNSVGVLKRNKILNDCIKFIKPPNMNQ